MKAGKQTHWISKTSQTQWYWIRHSIQIWMLKLSKVAHITNVIRQWVLMQPKTPGLVSLLSIKPNIISLNKESTASTAWAKLTPLVLCRWSNSSSHHTSSRLRNKTVKRNSRRKWVNIEADLGSCRTGLAIKRSKRRNWSGRIRRRTRKIRLRKEQHPAAEVYPARRSTWVLKEIWGCRRASSQAYFILIKDLHHNRNLKRRKPKMRKCYFKKAKQWMKWIDIMNFNRMPKVQLRRTKTKSISWCKTSTSIKTRPLVSIGIAAHKPIACIRRSLHMTISLLAVSAIVQTSPI